MEKVCNAIFEELAIVDRKRRGIAEACGSVGEGVRRLSGRGSARHDRPLGNGNLPHRLAHDLHDFRMLLGSFLSFVLVPFVYAQLLVQDNMDPELEMMTGTGSWNDHIGHIPLDIEDYPVAPPTLQLKQVHLFIRHGTF